MYRVRNSVIIIRNFLFIKPFAINSFKHRNFIILWIIVMMWIYFLKFTWLVQGIHLHRSIFLAKYNPSHHIPCSMAIHLEDNALDSYVDKELLAQNFGTNLHIRNQFQGHKVLGNRFHYLGGTQVDKLGDMGTQDQMAYMYLMHLVLHDRILRFLCSLLDRKFRMDSTDHWEYRNQVEHNRERLHLRDKTLPFRCIGQDNEQGNLRS